MKKVLLFTALILAAFTGCGNSNQSNKTEKTAKVEAEGILRITFLTGSFNKNGTYNQAGLFYRLLEDHDQNYYTQEFLNSTERSICMDYPNNYYATAGTFTIDGDLIMVINTMTKQKQKVIKYFCYPREKLNIPPDLKQPLRITAIANKYHEWEPAYYVPADPKDIMKGGSYQSLLQGSSLALQINGSTMKDLEAGGDTGNLLKIFNDFPFVKK